MYCGTLSSFVDSRSNRMESWIYTHDDLNNNADLSENVHLGGLVELLIILGIQTTKNMKLTPQKQPYCHIENHGQRFNGRR